VRVTKEQKDQDVPAQNDSQLAGLSKHTCGVEESASRCPQSIVYVMTSYPPSLGGVQLHAHELLKQLAPYQRQWVVSQWDCNRTDWLLGSTLFSPLRPKPYTLEGIEVRRLRFTVRDRLEMIPGVPPFYFAPALCSPWLARVFRRRLAPWLDGAELIHAFRGGRVNLVLAALQEARRRDIPFIFTPTHHPRWKGYRYKAYHSVYRNADRLIALTDGEAQELVALGVSPERISVLGSGPVLADHADPQGFRNVHGIGEYPFVLFLGQKYRYKGWGRLLEAAPLVWKAHPELRFVFVGPRTPYSERIFANAHDSRIIEMGPVSLEEKTSALAACSLLALPSRQESFGIVFTEAWSFGKPVIGARIPAVESVISDGMDGFLVEDDAHELADRICAIVRDASLAERMGIAGREKVSRRYSWNVLGKKMRAIYQAMA